MTIFRGKLKIEAKIQELNGLTLRMEFCDKLRRTGVYTCDTLLHRSRSQGTVHADFSIAKIHVPQPQAQVDRRGWMATGTSDREIAVRQFFRPQVLILLSLAAIWAGFIYGYKLSQYQQHPEVTRASLTRAWVDHRNDSIATGSHQPVRPATVLPLTLLTVTILALRVVAHRTPDLILEEPAPAREAFLFSSLIPFRAPPSTRPSLA